jgi:DNA-binding NarL/FixJ family response regulator
VGEREKLRVVVVDDSEVVRAKLRSLFEQQGIEVAGEAADGEEGLDQVASQKPDVVVMDLMMPGMSGIEATWRLGTVAPNTPVMMLTVSAEQKDVTDAIMAGAKGYVVKGGHDDEIVSTLRRLAAGERVVSPVVAEEIVEREYVARKEAREKVVPHHEADEAERAAREAVAGTDEDPPQRRLAQPLFPDLDELGRKKQTAVPTEASLSEPAKSGAEPAEPLTTADWLVNFCIALIAGGLLTVVALGDSIPDGFKAVLFVAISFGLLAMGLLARSGR